MSSYAFRDLSLQDAEEQLVSRCITDKAALLLALETLPLKPFRSLGDADLHAVFYTLAGWLAKGTYDTTTNEERLTQALASEAAPAYWWRNFFDTTWSPWTAIPSYFCDLLAALLDAYRHQDEQAQMVSSWLDTPFAPDQGYEDALYLRLQEAIVSRRAARHTPALPAVSPPPVAVDWEDLQRRAPHR